MSSKVSIIIPALKADGLKESIESCRFQSHKDIEILVACRTREVESLVYSIKDDRISVLATTIDSQASILAGAVNYVTGQQVCFLLPGDSQEHDRIAQQSKFDISLCNIHYTGVDPYRQPKIKKLTKEIFSMNQERENMLTLMVSTTILLEVGFFDIQSDNPIRDWMELMFSTYNYHVPILRSRLYRKG